MGPEQITEYWGPIGPQTDVYGLGAVLFTLLAGQPPGNGRSVTDVLAQVASATKAKPLTDYRDDVPSAVLAVTAKCLAKTATARFQTAAELRDALRQISGQVRPI